MLLVSALILLLLSLDFSNRLLQQTQSATLFCFYRNFWMTVAPVPGRPVDLGALYGGSLWLATEKGVYHFENGKWTETAEALTGKRPTALAASAAGVWVLDSAGDLSHFDGQRWSYRSLAGNAAQSGPGATWGKAAAQRAQLAAGDDGTLWLMLDGLWRFSGDAWSEVRPEGQEAIGVRLVGESAGSAWLARNGEVLAVSPDGRVHVRFHADVPGIGGHDVYSVSATPGRLWLATAGGFAVYDGTGWQNIDAPPHSGGILEAVPAFDGGMFAMAAAPPPGFTGRLVFALPVLLLSGATLLLLVYLFRYWKRIQRRASGGVDPLPAGTGWDPRNLLATRWTRTALETGDYRGALRKLRWLGAGLPSRHLLLLEGAVLSLSGIPEQAERCCRRALDRSAGPHARFALDRLANALADLGRYDEARHCLEEAIEIYDDFDLGNADLAELLLIEGSDCEQALDLVERAIAASPSPEAHLVGRQMDTEMIALRAWALAGLGRRVEAELLIRRALNRADQKCSPTLAGVYWRIGMALERMGDENTAITNFRNAVLVDRHGKYGNLAKLQIEQRATWGVSA